MFIIKVPLSLCRSTLGLLKVNTRRERERDSRVRETTERSVCERARITRDGKRYEEAAFNLQVYECHVCVCVCVRDSCVCMCLSCVFVCVYVCALTELHKRNAN